MSTPPPGIDSSSAFEAALEFRLEDPAGLRLRVARLPIEINGAGAALTVRRAADVGRASVPLRWRAAGWQATEHGAALTWSEVGLRLELQWRVDGSALRLGATLEHAGSEPLLLDEIAPLAVAVDGDVRVGRDASRWSVYRNGYQSWSGTRAYGIEAADADPWWGFLRDTVTDVRHPAAGRPGVVRSDLVTAIVDRDSGAALALGWLDAREWFGAVAVEAPRGRFRRLAAVLDGDGRRLMPGDRLELPELWLSAGDGGEALLAAWADACGAAMRARVGVRSPIGWCSWYYYFTRVRETDVLHNLDALQRLRPRIPCDYVMVDDGWQRAVGDWLEANGKFPHGMRWLAQRIRAAGFDAGIWLAPFIARPESRLFQQRPEWFVRSASGRPRSAVWNPMWSFGRPAYALDTTHPEVLTWLRELARTLVHQWGYRILKLDFLFAAALPGRRFDADATRAQALRRGLEAIRDGAGGEAFLLGCGCPLGQAVGIVDGMRIGADVAPFWSNWISRGLLRDRHGVATKNAIRNTLTRAFMHRRLWLNDPDCLMVRGTDTALTRDEVQSLAAAIALTDGMFVLSDDVDALPAERLGLIEQALELAGGRCRVVDLFERDMPESVRCAQPGGEVLGVFNFAARPVERQVRVGEAGSAGVRELWSGADLPASDGIVSLTIPPHGCRLLWLGGIEPEENEETPIDEPDE